MWTVCLTISSPHGKRNIRRSRSRVLTSKRLVMSFNNQTTGHRVQLQGGTYDAAVRRCSRLVVRHCSEVVWNDKHCWCTSRWSRKLDDEHEISNQQTDNLTHSASNHSLRNNITAVFAKQLQLIINTFRMSRLRFVICVLKKIWWWLLVQSNHWNRLTKSLKWNNFSNS